jgi:hypothetical protein
MGCYLFSLENYLIYIVRFLFYYNLNKRVPDYDFQFELRLTSWVIIALSPNLSKHLWHR